MGREFRISDMQNCYFHADGNKKLRKITLWYLYLYLTIGNEVCKFPGRKINTSGRGVTTDPRGLGGGGRNIQLKRALRKISKLSVLEILSFFVSKKLIKQVGLLITYKTRAHAQLSVTLLPQAVS